MITFEDLRYPKGRIHPDLFPERSDDDLAADVQAWIIEAYAQARVVELGTGAAQDQAAAAWAYYRAFDAACIALAANPSTHSQSDAGGTSYAKDQRDTVCRLAAEAKAEFQLLAPLGVVEAPRTGGGTVSHDFAW